MDKLDEIEKLDKTNKLIKGIENSNLRRETRLDKMENQANWKNRQKLKIGRSRTNAKCENSTKMIESELKEKLKIGQMDKWTNGQMENWTN